MTLSEDTTYPEHERCPDEDSCLIPEDYTPPRRTMSLGLSLAVKFPYFGRQERGFIVDGPLHAQRRTRNFDGLADEYEIDYMAHAYEIMGTSKRVLDERILIYATEIEVDLRRVGIIGRAFKLITGKRREC